MEQPRINYVTSHVTTHVTTYNYLDEKREALQQWADRLDDIITRE